MSKYLSNDKIFIFPILNQYWIFSFLPTSIVGLDIILYFNSKQFRTLNRGGDTETFDFFLDQNSK